MRRRIYIMTVVFALILSLALPSCSAAAGDASLLDPAHPVTITVWHYYNGMQQAAFDSIVADFNAGTGRELGIFVQGTSKGSVSDLEKAVTSAANGDVGAGELPTIFSSYADTAYALQQRGLLTDMSAYFTSEELAAYVEGYISEGYFNNDGSLYLFPVAKSTEIMMMNATDWAPFAEATGVTTDDLRTTESVTEVAGKYYAWTDSLTPDIEGDGKAFYGRDSMSNYFVIGMKQLGVEIFSVDNGKLTLNPYRDIIRRLWDNYYVPIVKGWFAAYGRFRSDDVKTGDLLCYTGSSSSSSYFPNNVDNGYDIFEIDYIVLPAPVMEGGANINVQQGAGMAVTAGSAQSEYAACQFIKWFTQPENNLRFAAASSYLPVTKAANSTEMLDSQIAEYSLNIAPKTYDCLSLVMDNFENTSYYTTACFENGFATRSILDYNLSDKAKADRAAVEAAIMSGTAYEDALAPYLTDENFDAWYSAFCETLAGTAGLN